MGGGDTNDKPANAIGEQGLGFLLEPFEEVTPTPKIIRMRLHNCQLGDNGVRRLLQFFQRTKTIPEEIHLSCNNISTIAALELAAVLGGLKSQFPFKTSTGNYPLWLRLEMNRIDALVFKDSCKSLGLSICPTARKGFGQYQCDTRHCITTPMAKLHCPFLSYQRIGVNRLIKNFGKVPTSEQSSRESSPLPYGHHGGEPESESEAEDMAEGLQFHSGPRSSIVQSEHSATPVDDLNDITLAATAPSDLKQEASSEKSPSTPRNKVKFVTPEVAQPTPTSIRTSQSSEPSTPLWTQTKPGDVPIPEVLTPKPIASTSPSAVITSTDTNLIPETAELTAPETINAGVAAKSAPTSVESVPSLSSIATTDDSTISLNATSSRLTPIENPVHEEAPRRDTLKPDESDSLADSLADQEPPIEPIPESDEEEVTTASEDDDKSSTASDEADVEDGASTRKLSTVSSIASNADRERDEASPSRMSVASGFSVASNLSVPSAIGSWADLAVDRVRPEEVKPLVYAVLDTNAVINMLTADREGTGAFSFLTALRTPTDHVEVQLVLLHTVNRELDGLKKNERHRINITDFLRDVASGSSRFHSPLDGLKTQCSQRGVLVELSEEEAELEVTYGGKYRGCDLQGSDAMILNVSWYLYSQLLATHGQSASVSVVLVTNDLNMQHWASKWKLPFVALDTLEVNYRKEKLADLSSAKTFLKCAGIKMKLDDTGTSLHRVLSQAHAHDTRSQVELLEAVLPKLELLHKLETALQNDPQKQLTADELRAILGISASTAAPASKDSAPITIPTSAKPDAPAVTSAPKSAPTVKRIPTIIEPHESLEQSMSAISIAGIDVAKMQHALPSDDLAQTRLLAERVAKNLDVMRSGLARAESFQQSELGKGSMIFDQINEQEHIDHINTPLPPSGRNRGHKDGRGGLHSKFY